LHEENFDASFVTARIAPGEQVPSWGAEACVLHASSTITGQIVQLRELRMRFQGLPLLVLCDHPRDLDHVLALEMGADIVVDTASSAAVLAAQVRAMWRRRWAQCDDNGVPRRLSLGGLTLDRDRLRVDCNGCDAELTDGEFEVLWLLAMHVGRPVPRRAILRCLRGIDEQPSDRSIDSRIYRIRSKLRNAGAVGAKIRCIRNHGYVFIGLDS
jgi:two-component system, OmpR family, response regulator RstA